MYLFFRVLDFLLSPDAEARSRNRHRGTSHAKSVADLPSLSLDGSERVEHHASGAKKRVTKDSGAERGSFEEWHPNGRRKHIEHYVDGRLVGSMTWDDQGRAQRKNEVSGDGIRTETEYFSLYGKPFRQTDYKNDVQQGSAIVWDCP